MNTPILNREFKLPTDDWYEVEVFGEHFNAEAGVVQVVDRPAAESIVNRFHEAAKEPGFAGILIDYDHFSMDPSKESRAAGWAEDLRVSNRGYEAKIRWSRTGRADVEGGDFRFFSTVYPAPKDCQSAGTRELRNRKGTAVPAVRPLALDRLAITNDPNNKGQRPISNRQPALAETAQPTKTTMKQVNVILGLAEDAPETSAVAEIQKIKNRAAALETENGTLKTERDGLLTAQVEADLEKYKGVIKNRDQVKAQLLANRGTTILILESLQPATVTMAGQDKITNRSGASTPGSSANGGDEKQAAAEKARAARITNRARELQSHDPKLKWGHAFAKAEAELTE